VIALHETASGITFAVRIHPRAKRNAVVGEIGEALKISLTAPPIDGRANEACIEFLAELLDLPRSSIAVISGHTSRNKVVRVEGLSTNTLRQRLQP
jgi:uncharacterized protein (TIGR00251 family)